MKNILSVLCLLLPVCGYAQSVNTKDSIKTASVDFSVPDSPAFTVLGLSPEQIAHPTTPREFGTALLNGFDQNGNFQSGVALDTTPLLLLRSVSLSDYEHWYWRIPANAQLSVATTKGVSDTDKTSKIAAGLQLILFTPKSRDPRRNEAFRSQLADAAKAARKAYNLTHTPPGQDATQAQIDAYLNGLRDAVEQSSKPVRDAYRKKDWNATKLAVAAAPSWTSPIGSLGSLDWNGAGFWSTFTYGFEGLNKVEALQAHSMLAFHFRYRNRETVADQLNQGKQYLQNSQLGGVRLLLGSDQTNGSLEFIFQHSHPLDGIHTDEDFTRLTVGAEHRISDGFWINFSFGGEGGRSQGRNKAFVMSTFKWGTSNASTLSQ